MEESYIKCECPRFIANSACRQPNKRASDLVHIGGLPRNHRIQIDRLIPKLF